ncbi:MAG: BMP family ABC transporter substrate-binding protein [Erysipelotrichaceae bacterium]|nr:BMP family ABC transporter substrate-binding protein [Erysipelotrichaceae bacterium]
MKKLLTVMLAVLMLLGMVGCNNGGGGKEPTVEHYDVVFLADLGSISDGGFNQFSYAGIVDYCKEHNLTYTYLQPAQASDDDRVTIFKQAADQYQAKVLVAVGYLWDAALVQCVPEYQDKQVIFIDADDLATVDLDYDGTSDGIPGKLGNVAMITFAEQDCGFLAGYAVVKDGYRNLAFFGGMAVPAVIRFGYGWVAGAEYAAKELGLEPGSINMTYWYSGDFNETPEKTTKVASWYQAGTEVVFSCGGTIVNSAITACEATENGKLVGVDIDESGKSQRIITSAMKSLENTVYNAVKAAYAGGDEWAAYTKALQTLGAKEEATTIAQTWDRFNSFGQADFDAIYAKLAGGLHDELPVNSTYNDPTEMTLTYVNLKYEN